MINKADSFAIVHRLWNSGPLDFLYRQYSALLKVYTNTRNLFNNSSRILQEHIQFAQQDYTTKCKFTFITIIQTFSDYAAHCFQRVSNTMHYWALKAH